MQQSLKLLMQDSKFISILSINAISDVGVGIVSNVITKKVNTVLEILFNRYISLVHLQLWFHHNYDYMIV